jgi:hypothetical protein
MFRHIPEDVINGKRPFFTGRPECTYELCLGVFNHILDGYIHTFATPRGESEMDLFCKELTYAITPIGKTETYMPPIRAEYIPNCDVLPKVLSIALYINRQLEEFRKNNKGLLIITHSRYIARYVDADEFINIEGMTKQEWLDREIVPTDFDSLDRDSSELFRALQDRMESRRG